MLKVFPYALTDMSTQLDQEAMTQDEKTLIERLTIADIKLDDVAEVVANDLSTIIAGASNARLDAVGRCRINRLCQAFQSFCFAQLSSPFTTSDTLMAPPSFKSEMATLVPEEVTQKGRLGNGSWL